MKHNTHIYLAVKAIELCNAAVSNTVDAKGKHLSKYKKSAERFAAEERRRMLAYYQHLTAEASWAPDDVLHDNDPYHIFKLFTEEEFPNHKLGHRPTFDKPDDTFIKFAGGLPYRIDHIAQQIITMSKLRDYNDKFTLRQLFYQYMLLSHYVVDAHVPMHCDLRDDPPSKKRSSQPSRSNRGGKPKGKYLKSTAHEWLESKWDKAVTPLAVEQKIVKHIRPEQTLKPTDLSDAVDLDLDDCDRGCSVQVKVIPKGKLLDFVIDICIEAKRRSQILFPIANPQQLNDDELEDITRLIFADSVGDLLSIWRYIWQQHRAD